MIWSYEGPCKILTHLDMPSLCSLHNHFHKSGTLKNCSGIFTKKMELNFGMCQWYGQEKLSKKCGWNWEKINSTCFTMCHLGQNRKWIYWAWWETWPKIYFAIFEGYITQTIYENYLVISEVTEIYVASQPRVLRVIPLSEKEYSQQKNIGLGKGWKWHDLGMMKRVTRHY